MPPQNLRRSSRFQTPKPAQATKRASKPRQKKATASSKSNPPSVPQTDETVDPTHVTHAVAELVNPMLSLGWQVNKDLKMHYIFDAVSPARVFTSRDPYNDNEEFVSWTKSNLEFITETDLEVSPRMPFQPKPVA